MRNAVLREGPRAPLFFLTASVALVALLSAFAANSQSVDMSALERCIALETEALKLRCFEAIIASSESDLVEESAAPESRVATSSPEQVIPTTDGAADDVVASGPAAPVAESAPTDVDTEVEISTAAATASEDAIGQEHLAQPEPEQEKGDTLLRATVIEVSKGRNDILYFSLDNDQVWRQIEARHFSYPKNSEFEVNINRGMMGEYRLRIGDNSQMVRVRRVK